MLSRWSPEALPLHAFAVLTAQAVAVVQRAMRAQAPEDVMADLGFGSLKLVASFPVKMSGA